MNILMPPFVQVGNSFGGFYCQLPCLCPILKPTFRFMLVKVFIAFLWSGVKYLIGAGLCLGMFSNPIMGFMISTLGAIFGIFIFTYGGLWIEEQLKRRFMANRSHFNKRSRMLVRLKRSGGLPLVAILTPGILSIPVGCILATTFVHSREKIVLYMTASVALWGAVIFGTQWVFNLDLASAIRFW